MTDKQTRLTLYKQALVDYCAVLNSWPVNIGKNATGRGFCWYFKVKLNKPISISESESFEAEFPELASQRKTVDRPYHYNQTGCTRQGIEDRISALRSAIEILER